jgi:hypothetical protein
MDRGAQHFDSAIRMSNFNVFAPIKVQLNLIVIKSIDIESINQRDLIDLFFLEEIQYSSIAGFLFNVPVFEIYNGVAVLEYLLLYAVFE